MLVVPVDADKPVATIRADNLKVSVPYELLCADPPDLAASLKLADPEDPLPPVNGKPVLPLPLRS
jgi:hypothetical protein